MDPYIGEDLSFLIPHDVDLNKSQFFKALAEQEASARPVITSPKVVLSAPLPTASNVGIPPAPLPTSPNGGIPSAPLPTDPNQLENVADLNAVGQHQVPEIALVEAEVDGNHHANVGDAVAPSVCANEGPLEVPIVPSAPLPSEPSAPLPTEGGFTDIHMQVGGGFTDVHMQNFHNCNPMTPRPEGLPKDADEIVMDENGFGVFNIIRRTNNPNLRIKADNLGISPYTQWRLINQIGQGGQGSVFRAKQDLPQVRPGMLQPRMPSNECTLAMAQQRMFAVKTLQARDADHLRRSWREVLLLDKLQSSTHVVDVYARGVHMPTRTIFLVMELADCDFATYLKERRKIGQPLSLHEFFDFWSQIVVCMKQSHDTKIIHLDVKPENFLMFGVSTGFLGNPSMDQYGSEARHHIRSSMPVLKLADFGVAVQMRQSRSHVSALDPGGTLFYRAPESFMPEDELLGMIHEDSNEDDETDDKEDSENEPLLLDVEKKKKKKKKDIGAGSVYLRAAADVWAIGIMGYEMAHNVNPFRALHRTPKRLPVILANPNLRVLFPEFENRPNNFSSSPMDKILYVQSMYLIQQCLKQSPHTRIRTERLLDGVHSVSAGNGRLFGHLLVDELAKDINFTTSTRCYSIAASSVPSDLKHGSGSTSTTASKGAASGPSGRDSNGTGSKGTFGDAKTINKGSSCGGQNSSSALNSGSKNARVQGSSDTILRESEIQVSNSRTNSSKAVITAPAVAPPAVTAQGVPLQGPMTQGGAPDQTHAVKGAFRSANSAMAIGAGAGAAIGVPENSNIGTGNYFNNIAPPSAHGQPQLSGIAPPSAQGQPQLKNVGQPQLQYATPCNQEHVVRCQNQGQAHQPQYAMQGQQAPYQQRNVQQPVPQQTYQNGNVQMQRYAMQGQQQIGQPQAPQYIMRGNQKYAVQQVQGGHQYAFQGGSQRYMMQQAPSMQQPPVAAGSFFQNARGQWQLQPVFQTAQQQQQPVQVQQQPAQVQQQPVQVEQQPVQVQQQSVKQGSSVGEVASGVAPCSTKTAAASVSAVQQSAEAKRAKEAKETAEAPANAAKSGVVATVAAGSITAGAPETGVVAATLANGVNAQGGASAAAAAANETISSGGATPAKRTNLTSVSPVNASDSSIVKSQPEQRSHPVTASQDQQTGIATAQSHIGSVASHTQVVTASCQPQNIGVTAPQNQNTMVTAPAQPGQMIDGPENQNTTVKANVQNNPNGNGIVVVANAPFQNEVILPEEEEKKRCCCCMCSPRQRKLARIWGGTLGGLAGGCILVGIIIHAVRVSSYASTTTSGYRYDSPSYRRSSYETTDSSTSFLDDR